MRRKDTDMSTKDDKPQSDQCAPCDLEGIDNLACTAARFQRQAEVINGVAGDLETYRTQYGGAKKAYSTAWDAANAEIATIRTQLDTLYEQLRCRLSDGKRECLETARDDVFADIDECAGPLGCCVGPCEFSDTISDTDDVASLTARIQQYRDETTSNTACFIALIAEPDALAARVAAIKSEVTALASDVAGGGDATLVVKWYARWLIADKQLELNRIGNGFTTVAAYMDCLCAALTCVSSGWTVIAVLEGAMAELACKDAAKAKACQQKKDDILDAVLDAYQECCDSGSDDSATSDTPSGGKECAEPPAEEPAAPATAS